MSFNYECSMYLQKSPNFMNLNKNLPKINNSLTNYMNLIKNIKHKIWLHNNKKEFFNKTSIIYYLNKISNINNINPEITLSKEKYKRLLQEIKKEIEGYENIVYIQSNMIHNLNVSQDIQRLRDTRQSEDIKNNDRKLNQYSKVNIIDGNDSLTNISQISLTNDDFQYSDLHPNLQNCSDYNNEATNNFVNLSTSNIFECVPRDLHTFSGRKINTQDVLNDFQNATKEIFVQKNTLDTIRKSPIHINHSLSLNSDLPCLNFTVPRGNLIVDNLNEFDMNSEPSHIQRNQNSNTKDFNEFQTPSCSSISVVPSTNMESLNTASAYMRRNIPNLYKDIHVDSGVSSMKSTSCDDCIKVSKRRKVFYNEGTYKTVDAEKDVCDVEENPFNNPEVVKQRLQELHSMTNVFKTCVLEDIDKMVAEMKEIQRIAETSRKPVQINPFFFNKNYSFPPTHSDETHETTLTDNDITCEELSFVYTKKYKELFDNTESDNRTFD